ncbi:Lar family restriction alleviation protein [Serratia fonticola]|uniref:Lar family restriction alleviation protein n=1 Tax=Serratia fonticola TaxID=47917 RepID=UPI00301D0763
MNAHNIKPCPFCGGHCKTIKGTANLNEWKGTFWRVFCTSCQTRQLFHKTEVRAIEAWNHRAVTPNNDDLCDIDEELNAVGQFDDFLRQQRGKS